VATEVDTPRDVALEKTKVENSYLRKVWKIRSREIGARDRLDRVERIGHAHKEIHPFNP
jgi:hypothetical protein